MAIYNIEAPDGKIYKVEGEEGKGEEALKFFQSQWVASKGAPSVDSAATVDEREQSQVKAVAATMGESSKQVEAWTKGARIDGKNIRKLRDERIEGFVPGDPELTALLNDRRLSKGRPELVQRAQELREKDAPIAARAERLRRINQADRELQARVEAALPETLSFAGFETPIPLNKNVAATLVGMGDMMMDTINGIQQIVGVNEAELAQDQAAVKELYASSRAGPAGAGAVIGAIAEPIGVLLPVAKTATLWKTALQTTAVAGGFGAAGYVDKEAGQTRLGNAAIAAAGGAVLSPVVNSLNKANGMSPRALAKSGNTIIDNFELQTKKYQTSGASTELALRAAKKKFGYTDETLAAAVNNTDRKINIVTPRNAREQLRAIEDFESAMTVAPTTRAGKLTEDLIAPISTRLQRLSVPVFSRMKKHDLNVQLREARNIKTADPFLKVLDTIKGEDGLRIQKALMTGDAAEVSKILKATGNSGAIKSYANVRKLLAQTHQDLTKVGYKLPKIDNYFPRIVKDVQAVSKIQQDQVSTALREARKKKGTELTTLDISRVMDTLVLGTRNRAFSSTSGSLQRRSKSKIEDALLPYYASPTESLRTYIRSTSSDIEKRQLFKDFGHNKQLDVIGGDLDDSIGSLLASGRLSGLSKDAQNEVTTLLRARFGPGEQSGAEGLQVMKNLIYTVTLGNPVAAATQIGDIVFSAQKNGIINTVQSLFGNKLVKKDTLGLTDAVQEIVSSRNKVKAALDWSLKYGGFTSVDKLGKETLLNASLRKFNKQSKTPKGQEAFAKEWGKYFGEETQQLMKDIGEKKLTENVKLLLWHELSGVQPISLTEMPLKYLQYPNGRVLYMLRSFTIKQLDFMRRGILNKARKEPGKAAVLAAKFAGLFIIGNSSVDALKDFMQGKDIDMEDHFVDNAWSLLGVNKYTVDSVTRQGPGRAVIDFIAPPLTVFDDVYRGANDPKRLWNLLPPYGKLIGAWSESDQDKYFNSIDTGKFEPLDIQELLKEK